MTGLEDAPGHADPFQAPPPKDGPGKRYRKIALIAGAVFGVIVLAAMIFS